MSNYKTPNTKHTNKMKKNKRKQQEFKKPFLVLNRRKLFGWGVAIFFLCAWMFVLGVLVGRDTAPVKFDIKKLKQKISDTRGQPQTAQPEKTSRGEVEVKDKTKLGFYERLPEDQQDIKVPEIKKQPADQQKPSAASDVKAPDALAKTTALKTNQSKAPSSKAADAEKKKKAPAAATQKKPSGAVYTVQAAALKKMEDADQLVTKLKKKGYPAYRAIGKVPEKGIWFRVRVGKYQSRTEAKKTQQKLKKLGLKPIIVKQD
jgi:cell division septation protein DedD